MGRIEEALKRAKETQHQGMGRKGNLGWRRHSNGEGGGGLRDFTRRPEAGKPVFQDLWQSATKYFLDEDTLTGYRVTTESQAMPTKSAYKMLRTRVLQRMRANHWNTLAISSARSNAGKTLTAINTSISIASDPNQQVVLVDLDLRRPTVAKYLGIEHKFGLTDYLLNDVPIEKVAVKTQIDKLMVIPNYAAQENSSELITSDRMKALVRRLAADSDGSTIIFDLPPMLDADDMLAFSDQVDALLFVVAECETRKADLQQVSDLVEDMNVLGVILNKSDDESPAYY